MNRKQALNALIEGHVITHKLLRPIKFMYKVGTKILDNNGDEIMHDSRLLKLLTHTSSLATDGWEIVHPAEIKAKLQRSNRIKELVKSSVIDILLAFGMWFIADLSYTALNLPEEYRNSTYVMPAAFVIGNFLLQLKKSKHENK